MSATQNNGRNSLTPPPTRANGFPALCGLKTPLTTGHQCIFEGGVVVGIPPLWPTSGHRRPSHRDEHDAVGAPITPPRLRRRPITQWLCPATRKTPAITQTGGDNRAAFR